MDVNFELYKVFYHVASTLSFSEASKRLFISQSAVSQSIKVLEGKLGCKLLFRNTKKVKQTPEGKVLFKSVEQAFNFIKKGERNLYEMQSLIQGEIRIGASDTICKYYLLPYFKKFNKIYPGIKIHITNRTSPSCISLLQKGYVDFSVINIPTSGSYKNMKITEMKNIQDVFIAGKEFNNLRNKKIEFRELVKYPLLTLEKNTATRDFLETLALKNNVKLSPEIELSSVELLVEMAKIGLGISYVMSDAVLNESEDDVFILNLKEKIPQRKLGIITHENIPLPIACERFIDMLLPEHI